ncbi:MAG: hypothetical protein AAGA54_18455 [Myxococcota bacterium]
MSDPKDEQLAPDDRDLLAAFMAEERLPDETAARVRARVLETAAPAVAGTATVIRGPWVVAGIVAAAAAVLLAVSLRGDAARVAEGPRVEQAADHLQPSADVESAALEARPHGARPARPAPTPPTPDAEPAPVEPATPSAEAPRGTAPKAPDPGSKRRKRPASPTDPGSAPEPAPSASSLAAETRALQQARAALKDGRPQDALSKLDRAAQAFPDGALIEERAALRVLALCEAGRADEGRAAAAAFETTYPRSAHAKRVANACPTRR